MTWTNTAFKGLGDTSSGPNPLGFTGSTHYNNAEINGEYHLTASLLIGAAYDYMKGSSISSTKHGRLGGATYQQVSLGADYSLSKRTDVYVMGMYHACIGNGLDGRRSACRDLGKVCTTRFQIADLLPLELSQPGESADRLVVWPLNRDAPCL
ncbi:porin, partial [Paraburkholderia sp. DGU8]|uniref:porin n=1 Tax=Paraburkholderia sp. DGU8 TaxID=3161997 RepID=UPI0034656935